MEDHDFVVPKHKKSITEELETAYNLNIILQQ